jgi:hypothetical protein
MRVAAVFCVIMSAIIVWSEVCVRCLLPNCWLTCRYLRELWFFALALASAPLCERSEQSFYLVYLLQATILSKVDLSPISNVIDAAR